MKMQTVNSSKVKIPPADIKSNCKIYNGQVFIAGMTGRSPDGSIPKGMYEQTCVVFQKIKDLMEAAGGKIDDVIQINIFVTEMNVPDFWRARRQFFSGDFPVSTFVQVAALADPELVVEINAIGFLGAS